jgi:HK97 family phage prohead protease
MFNREIKDGSAFKGEYGGPTPLDFELKELSAEGEFEGYAATFGNVDKGSDIVMPGAFTESLRRRPAGKVKMLLQHDTRRLCGVWTSMVEDGKGLKVQGRLLLSIQDGKETYELMRVGALDAMSIGYRTLKDEYDRVNGTRKLITLDLPEVSVVTFPMNDKATISAVKAGREFTTQDWRDMEAALRDEGLSRNDAVKAVSGFKTWLRRDAGASQEGPRDEVSPADAAAIASVFQGLAERIRA